MRALKTLPRAEKSSNYIVIIYLSVSGTNFFNIQFVNLKMPRSLKMKIKLNRNLTAE